MSVVKVGDKVRWNVRSFRGPALYGHVVAVEVAPAGDTRYPFGRVVVEWSKGGRHEYPLTLWHLRFDIVDSSRTDVLAFDA